MHKKNFVVESQKGTTPKFWMRPDLSVGGPLLRSPAWILALLLPGLHISQCKHSSFVFQCFSPLLCPFVMDTLVRKSLHALMLLGEPTSNIYCMPLLTQKFKPTDKTF